MARRRWPEDLLFVGGEVCLFVCLLFVCLFVCLLVCVICWLLLLFVRAFPVAGGLCVFDAT